MRSRRVCQSSSQHPKARPKMTCVKVVLHLAKQVFGSRRTVPQHPFRFAAKQHKRGPLRYAHTPFCPYVGTCTRRERLHVDFTGRGPRSRFFARPAYINPLVNEGSFLVFGPIRKERKMVWIYCNLRKCSVPAATAGSRLPICMPAVGCLYHLPGILWSSRLLLIGLGI